MANCRLICNAIFTFITFAITAFLIFATFQISNLSVQSGIITTSRVFTALQSPCNVYYVPGTSKMNRQVQSNPNKLPPQIIQQKTEENSMPTQAANEEEVKEEDEAPDVIPPSNLTRQERTEWFRKIVPRFELLKSNDLGQKFHGRVMQFFNKQCTNQFFMIWLSPASKFGPRDFLAVETLLKANPEACLMILSKSLDTRRGNRILKPLLDRGLKIAAVAPDLPFLAKNTPAEAWLDDIKSGKKDPGIVSLSINLSNLMRLAVLYKYGGIYLDTDFIVINNFKGLRNTVGVQTIDQNTQQWKHVNNALLIFDIAHPILFQFLEDFSRKFDGTKWGHNGPYMLSRVIRRLNSEGTPGYNITLQPTRAFYPMHWLHVNRHFRTPKTEKESKWVEDTVAELNGESFALHLWNSRARELVIEEGSVMQRLIASHCFICLDNYNS